MSTAAQKRPKYGRKKTCPIWEFFTDLSTFGCEGARCHFCKYVERNCTTKAMKTHIEKHHDTGRGGLWDICEQKLASHLEDHPRPNSTRPKTTQVKKNQEQDQMIQGLLERFCPMGNVNPVVPPVPEEGDGTLLFDGLQEIPHACSEQLINARNALEKSGNTSKDPVTSHEQFVIDLLQPNATSRNSPAPPAEVHKSSGGFTVDALLSSSRKDAVMVNSRVQNSKQPEIKVTKGPVGSHSKIEFKLIDVKSISALVKIAQDSNLNFWFSSRPAEFSFCTTQGEARSVLLADTGPEIKVTLKVADVVTSVETWLKTDLSQFGWAVRGTCLQFLKA